MMTVCSHPGCRAPATKVVSVCWLFGDGRAVFCEDHVDEWVQNVFVAVLGCDDNAIVDFRDYANPEVKDEGLRETV